MTGELKEDGSFKASGTGVVAGRPNIRVEFDGKLSSTGLTGNYTMGVGGGLPNGQSITYTVQGQREGP